MTDKLQPKDEKEPQEMQELAAEGEASIEGEASELDEQSEAEQELSELDLAKRQAEEYLDGWQRARAELANYKKRAEREKGGMSVQLKGDIFSRYLPIVDDLERALQDRPDGSDADAWAEGIELIYKKIRDIMEAEGVQAIAVEGEPFDPVLHDALSHEQSEKHESGLVIEVIQQGYQIDERVIRPALVRVAK